MVPRSTFRATSWSTCPARWQRTGGESALRAAVLERCRRQGMTHVVLDGTLIESDRLAGVRDNGNDLWFSQKHKAFGGHVQFLAAPDGTPLWVSDVEPFHARSSPRNRH